MSKKKQATLGGAMGKLLYTEKFFALARTLQEWRLDPVMQQMDATRDEGRILGFVKGLRLSAQIAYVVRDILSGEDARVSWGHLVDDAGQLCSPECDIIIHRPGHIQQWNGGIEPIMDFKFIECTKALAVISCKSFAKSVDKDYCKSFAQYGMKKILLFAECCQAEKTDSLKQQAKKAGYSGFHYLYTLEKDGFSVKQDPDVYAEFIELVKNLVAEPVARRRTAKRGTRARRKKIS